MKFQLNEQLSDLVLLAKACGQAEQNGRNKLPPDVRHLLGRAAHMLNECKGVMATAIDTLEEARGLRAGLMDSQSRNDEVKRQKDNAMLEVTQHMRGVLCQHTPASQPESEVI